MNPSVDDRLNSVLRALQSVVLPALPESANLAREQIMLAMGHIQIIQAQRDATPGYEEGERADIADMARALLAVAGGGEPSAAARAELETRLADKNGLARERAEAVREAIDALLLSAHAGDERDYHRRLAAAILPLGRARADKDRGWFAPMGFDSEKSA